MNITSYILQQVLRRLRLPEPSVQQFRVVASLSNVDDRGFPRELFELSAPVVVRGLLNFAVLQMHSGWVYPFWATRQLDPNDPAFIPRSQNPLLINVTHRSWTAIGSPQGFHEAIIDPRGLMTPLPREWSVDVWLETEGILHFPSHQAAVRQSCSPSFPIVRTDFSGPGVSWSVEHFTSPSRSGTDVVFSEATVTNRADRPMAGHLIIAIRPFNPEGVAPIHRMDIHHRHVMVDRSLGVVMEQEPVWTHLSNADRGDCATSWQQPSGETGIRCTKGLANGLAAFAFHLDPGSSTAVHFSTALGGERKLRHHAPGTTWRTPYSRKKHLHEERWAAELKTGAGWSFGDDHLQHLFDACILTLLQLQEGEFVSPGPYLYHHFWYRDAALMVRALDLLGFRTRAKSVIDAFPRRLTDQGYFRGPDGEWDSNGAVLWTVLQHFQLTRSHLWLRQWWPNLEAGARWIDRMRSSTPNGLLPPSLSAEHLGTVDQYFWDSLWALAGLRAVHAGARALKRVEEERRWEASAAALTSSLRDAFARVHPTAQGLIPATPTRVFDKSAIGSVAAVYPLALFGPDAPEAMATVREIHSRYVDEQGFYHPIIHSGYNPYLTLQIAHALLWMGEEELAWTTAETIFRKAAPPYSFPEAIHPKTGGGSMGDGHHGWAAAEVVLFIRDCLVREKGNRLEFFGADGGRLVSAGRPVSLRNVPTTFGPVSVDLNFESATRAVLRCDNGFFPGGAPDEVVFHLPFVVRRVLPLTAGFFRNVQTDRGASVITCGSGVRTLLLDL